MIKNIEHCYCDRCKREIKKGETVNYRYYPDLRYEFCDNCVKIFEKEEKEYRKLKIEHERMEKEYQLDKIEKLDYKYKNIYGNVSQCKQSEIPIIDKVNEIIDKTNKNNKIKKLKPELLKLRDDDERWEYVDYLRTNMQIFAEKINEIIDKTNGDE